MAQPTNTPRERRLKVYPKFFYRVLARQRNVVFPEIRLCGKWLEQTGFYEGQHIIVRHEQNKIVITPAEDE